MSFRYCIRLSGAGGQGLIQAGRILAEAVAVYGNMNAAESCSYGPEARGNASRAEVIISDKTIDIPKVDTVDLLLTLTQEAYDKYISDLKPGGILIIDKYVNLPHPDDSIRIHTAPFIDIAEKTLGKSSVVNVMVLGFLAKTCSMIDIKSMRQSILGRVPKMTEDIFIRAFELGLEAATQTDNCESK